MVKLYHSTPYPADNFRVINPGTRNVGISETPEGPVAHNVEYNESNIPYVYATDRQQFSITYAIDKGVRLANYTFSEHEVLLVEKESVIGDPALRGGVFSFESDRFMPILMEGKKSAQWVSPDPVDLLKADFLPVRSLNDIMKSGVQVYQIAEHADHYQLYLEMEKFKGNDAKQDLIFRDWARSGALRCLNDERGINSANLFSSEVSLVKKADIKVAIPTPDR